MLSTGVVKSEKDYSCVIVYEGTCKINSKEIKEMEYANLKKSKEYDIIVPDGSSVAFFELL